MSKTDFLNELKKRINTLPSDEVEKYVSFYSELIDDKTEDGMSEALAIESLGSISAIADEILRNAGARQNVPEKDLSNNNDNKSMWKAVFVLIAILGIPVWVPTLFSIIGVYIGIWGTIIGFYAASVGMFIGGVALIVNAFVTISLGTGASLFSVGAGLIVVSLSILFFIAACYASKGLTKLTKYCFKAIKQLISKGKEKLK